MVKGASIGHASGEGVIGLGTEAWNIADGYTKIKILRLLIEIDLHENIAMFGRKDMEEYIPEEIIPYKRVEAFQRTIFNLKQLIGNCKFAIQKKNDIDTLNKMIERIENIEEVIDGISTELYNDVTKETELRINEEHFNKCFQIIRAIKDELNIPINHAGLIFKHSDEMDLDKIMSDIIEGG